ncbi:hypothetical protein, partial [Neisseria meningitidis]|uniref:hypothetical protein n=1 Tax=Neisseria meningitidis TaxID=487 RepID=UPI0039893C53
RGNDGGAISTFPINDRNLKSRHPHESKNPACRISVFFGRFGKLMNRHSRAGGNLERGTAAIFKGCLKIQRF